MCRLHMAPWELGGRRLSETGTACDGVTRDKPPAHLGRRLRIGGRPILEPVESHLLPDSRRAVRALQLSKVLVLVILFAASG